MKKILAVLLVLATVAALALPTLAAGGSTQGTAEGNSTINISGKYDNTKNSQEAPVISADITWDPSATTFVYTKPHIGTWNPEKNAYEGAVKGGWSDAMLPITVANHSDTHVKVEFRYTIVQNRIGGSFYKKNSDNTYSEIEYFLLESAVGKSIAAADSDTAYLGISGSDAPTTGKIGTVTITISDATKKVSTKQELQDAAQNGGYIILQNDIDLGSARVDIGEDSVIDLNGHTVTSSSTVIHNVSYTTIKNGTVKCTSTTEYVCAIETFRSISIEDCTLISSSPAVIGAAAYVEDDMIGLRNVIIQTSDNTGWLKLFSDSTNKYRIELSGDFGNNKGLVLPESMLNGSNVKGIYGIYIIDTDSANEDLMPDASYPDHLTVTAGEGYYACFDPTDYYDSSNYDIVPSGTTSWYVKPKS